MKVIRNHTLKIKQVYSIIILCVVFATVYYVFFFKARNDAIVIDLQSNNSAQKSYVLENNIQQKTAPVSPLNHPLSVEGDNVNFKANVERPNTKDRLPVLSVESQFSEKEQRAHLEKLNIAQNLASQGNWDEFMALNDDLSSADAGSLKHTLVLTIMNDAPIDLILSLLNQGAVLDFEILRVLISKQDLSLIQTFVDFGLDLQMTDSQGKNATYYASAFPNNADILDYLISHGVNVMPKS
ncbi:hypothetical protein [Glaciecola sp. SC05]|uniref:hypothetical protein n=1 Tax=Glaciecola sp. SC05 TaxID=1987355 RepID=UPI003529C465